VLYVALKSMLHQAKEPKSELEDRRRSEEQIPA
jgi:hypothetical protein